VRSRTGRRVLRDELVTLAHGAGGKATRDLVEALFLEELGSEQLAPLADAAVVPARPPEGAEPLDCATEARATTGRFAFFSSRGPAARRWSP